MRAIVVCLGVFAAGMLWAEALTRAEEKKAETAPAHDAEPSPIHKQMAKAAGEYVTVTKFRIKPDDQPVETKGKARIKSILGGRFLAEESEGTMLGQKYQGFRLWGYNKDAKQFESTWIYTGATGTMRLVGTSKDKGKTINWTATVAMGQGEKMTMEAVTRHMDDDTFVVELIAKTPDGKRGPSFETTYTRKK
jgi:hypothetical protein